MNRTSTSPNIVAIPPLQRTQFLSRLTHLEALTPLNRCDILGQQVSELDFPPPTRPCVRSKGLGSTMNRMSTLPNIVVSPQLL